MIIGEDNPPGNDFVYYYQARQFGIEYTLLVILLQWLKLDCDQRALKSGGLWASQAHGCIGEKGRAPIYHIPTHTHICSIPTILPIYLVHTRLTQRNWRPFSHLEYQLNALLRLVVPELALRMLQTVNGSSKLGQNN